MPPQKHKQEEQIKIGNVTLTYRTVLLLLIASITPAGDRLWALAGLKRETDPKGIQELVSSIEAVAKATKRLESKVNDVHDDVADLSGRVQAIETKKNKPTSQL